jgi:hypothetical protein
MITEKTRNILIESAWWDPGTIRKASKRHAMHTDASHRFDRGADFESTIVSTDRVAELILASGGGTLTGDIIDVVVGARDQAPIVLNTSEVHRILGKALSVEQILRILTRLGFEFAAERDGGSYHQPPRGGWMWNASASSKNGSTALRSVPEYARPWRGDDLPDVPDLTPLFPPGRIRRGRIHAFICPKARVLAATALPLANPLSEASSYGPRPTACGRCGRLNRASNVAYLKQGS